jgi:predicted lipoprotein with Yx(FWY)xxD motif
MRKSGFAAAAGIGSLALLLAACGGSSSSSSVAGAASGQPAVSSGSAPAGTSSVSAASTSSQSPGSTTTAKAKAKAKATPHKSVGPQPSGPSDERSIPPIGTTVMIVQKSAIGFVLAEANHDVVYTYAKDKKGGTPTCTGACAKTWVPATGTPQAGPGDHFPGQFALVKNPSASGGEQITYDGMPLYTLAGAKPLLTTGNNQGGVWHVVKLSASDVG